MLEFLIEKRKNPYSEETKQYLFEVINEALENLPQNKEFLKANRTLENLLKTTVSIFAKNRGKGENKRNEINKEDLKQAYQLIISPDTTLLDQIENNDNKVNDSGTSSTTVTDNKVNDSGTENNLTPKGCE